VRLVGYLKIKGLMNIFHLADSILNISFEKTKTSYWESEYWIISASVWLLTHSLPAI